MTTVIRQTNPRISSTLSLDDLTAKYLKDNYLTGFTFSGANGQELPDEFFEEKIASSIAKLEDITNIDVMQREITGEVHDHWITDWMNFAFMQLYRIPAQSVSGVRAMFTTGVAVQVYPQEWVRLQVEHSQFQLMPTAGTLAQILIGSGADYLAFGFGASYMPSMWEVDYVSGFPPDAIPREIISVICKLAAIEVLTIMSDLIGPLGIASSSLGIDGMSQSTSRQLPAFKARIDSYKADLGLPGYGLANTGMYNTGEIGQLRRTYFGMALVSL